MKKLGFTLVELLTVIAIVGVIAALLLPVFAAAREKGRQATCTSNLRQLGSAFSMYAQDYDDCLPNPGGYGGGGFWDNVDENGRSDTLDQYLKSRQAKATQVWVCPNLNSGTLDPPPKGDSLYHLNFPRSYSMNTFLRAPAKTVVFKYNRSSVNVSDPDSLNPASDPNGSGKLRALPDGIARSAIPYPSATVLLFEGIPSKAEPKSAKAAFNGYVTREGDWRYVAGYWKTLAACASIPSRDGLFKGETCQDTGFHEWHAGTLNNYLYCDGHVQSHPPVKEGWTPSTSDPGGFLVKHCRDASAPCP